MCFSISSVLVLWFLCNYCLNYTKNEGNYWSTKLISWPLGKHTEVDIQSHSYSHLWPISNQQPSPIPMFLNYGNRERPHRHGENTQRLDSNLGPGDVANSTTVNGLNLWERNLPKQFFGCSLFIPAQQILEVPQLWRDSPATTARHVSRPINTLLTDIQNLSMSYLGCHGRPEAVSGWGWAARCRGYRPPRGKRPHCSICAAGAAMMTSAPVYSGGSVRCTSTGHLDTHTNTHFSYLPYFSVCNSDVSNESYKSQ